MRCALGKLCTGILIKATSLISCIVSTSFFPYICQLSLSTALGEEADLSEAMAKAKKSKPVPFPGMAVNTVYREEIHPRTLWMTLGASVH